MALNPLPADWLRPDWHAPGAGALMTTRAGGVSAAPFDSMNVRPGLGDAPAAVAENRRRLEAAISAASSADAVRASPHPAGVAPRPVYLRQVHGTRVLRLTRADAESADEPEADAAITTDFGVACTAQVADCLPVLFAAPGGVAAAHAGWRGLASGVLEATVAALCEATGCAPEVVQAWLGPCIGPAHFEVGADVVAAFAADGTPTDRFFEPRGAAFSTASGQPKWLADLPGLARKCLAGCGVTAVTGGRWCTVAAPSRFFSYRRDGVTGRMVACIWRHHGA